MNAFWWVVREIYWLRETLTKNFEVNSTNVTESNERTNTRTNERTNERTYERTNGQTSRRKLYTPRHKCWGYNKTLPPSGPLSYLHGLALKTWTSYWKKEGSAGMDMWNAPTVQSRQPLTYRLMESMGLGGPRWLGSSWQRRIADSGSSQLSTLMTEIPGDLVWDLPCVQQASCLKGGPLLWIWPLYLHINKQEGLKALNRSPEKTGQRSNSSFE